MFKNFFENMKKKRDEEYQKTLLVTGMINKEIEGLNQAVDKLNNVDITIKANKIRSLIDLENANKKLAEIKGNTDEVEECENKISKLEEQLNQLDQRYVD